MRALSLREFSGQGSCAVSDIDLCGLRKAWEKAKGA